MELFTSLTQQLAAVRQLVGEVSTTSELPEIVRQLSDDQVLKVLTAAAAAVHELELVQLAATGVVAERSTREAGHAGLAQSRGFRNPATLIQQLTGATRAEALRGVRVGESLFEQAPAWPEGMPLPTDMSSVTQPGGDDAGEGAGSPDSGAPAAVAPPEPWHAPLRAALLDGSLSESQHDAIRTGLGEPPAPSLERETAGDEIDSDEQTAATGARTFAELQQEALVIAEAWRLAAEELIREARYRTVEELRQAARNIRDTLDPVSAEARSLARYEARSFRLWRDAAGAWRGSFTFDDESGALVRSLIDTALRPRRGGPRFVDPAEKARAQQLIDDPRTNDQLTHDLMIDAVSNGIAADPAITLAAQKPSVRVVTVLHRDDRPTPLATSSAGTPSASPDARPSLAELKRQAQQLLTQPAPSQPGWGISEADGAVLPAGTVTRYLCNTGLVNVIMDAEGNPLNMGRTQRLFTSTQRVALSLRDGGCRWLNCDRPAAYCEAHHIDEWVADRGRTDIDRGILICRYHHGQLHHGGWRITRDGDGPFILRDKHGASYELPVRADRSTMWNFAALTPLPPRLYPRPGTPPTPGSPRERGTLPISDTSPGSQTPDAQQPSPQPSNLQQPAAQRSDQTPIFAAQQEPLATPNFNLSQTPTPTVSASAWAPAPDPTVSAVAREPATVPTASPLRTTNSEPNAPPG